MRPTDVDATTTQVGDMRLQLAELVLPAWVVVPGMKRDLLSRRIIQENSGGPGKSHCVVQLGKVLFSLRRDPCLVDNRIGLHDNTLTLMGERLPNLFREERHEGVK